MVFSSLPVAGSQSWMKPVALRIFASPGCLSCRELIPGLNEVRKTRGSDFDFLVVCRGDVESCQSFGRMNGLEAPMLVDTNGQIEKDYLVTLTPFAYLLDHEGKVVIRGVANDWRQLESLLEQEGTLQATPFVAVDGEPEPVGQVRRAMAISRSLSGPNGSRL